MATFETKTSGPTAARYSHSNQSIASTGIPALLTSSAALLKGALIGEGSTRCCYSINGHDKFVLIHIAPYACQPTEKFQEDLLECQQLMTITQSVPQSITTPRIAKVWAEENDIYYVVDRAPGNPLHKQNSGFAKWQSELCLLAEATVDQYRKWIDDIATLGHLGLRLDWSKSDNFYYDRSLGFIAVDLHVDKFGNFRDITTAYIRANATDILLRPIRYGLGEVVPINAPSSDKIIKKIIEKIEGAGGVICREQVPSFDRAGSSFVSSKESTFLRFCKVATDISVGSDIRETAVSELTDLLNKGLTPIEFLIWETKENKVDLNLLFSGLHQEWPDELRETEINYALYEQIASTDSEKLELAAICSHDLLDEILLDLCLPEDASHRDALKEAGVVNIHDSSDPEDKVDFQQGLRDWFAYTSVLAKALTAAVNLGVEHPNEIDSVLGRAKLVESELIRLSGPLGSE